MFYSRTGEMVEIIVRDFSGAKLDSFKFKVNDNETAKKVLRVLKSKYGLDIFEKKDKDIDWLNKDKW